MKTSLFSALLALVVAVALGLIAQSRPAAPRSANLIRPVPASWYAALPTDPERATQAFLDRVPPVMRERGEAISQTRYWALAARVVFNLGALLLFLRFDGAAALARAVGRVNQRQWLRDLMFAVVLLLFLFIVTLPVEIVASYARYRAFGFSDQPFAGWLQDYAVGWLGSAPFYAIGIAILMAVIRRRPRTWFLWAGLVYLALAALYTVATPLLIEPLTNSYTPIADGPIKQAIVSMARRAGIAVTDVYTDDASRQSRRLNGHVSGALGSARVTIDDTALGSNPAEIEALAAHEMGHFALGHPLKLVIFASLVFTLGFGMRCDGSYRSTCRTGRQTGCGGGPPSRRLIGATPHRRSSRWSRRSPTMAGVSSRRSMPAHARSGSRLA
jgi:STE24 endopeptidase